MSDGAVNVAEYTIYGFLIHYALAAYLLSLIGPCEFPTSVYLPEHLATASKIDERTTQILSGQ